MTVTYSLKQEDLVAFLRFQCQHENAKRGISIPWFWILFLGGIVLIFFLTKYERRFGVAQLTLVQLVFAVVVALLAGMAVGLFVLPRLLQFWASLPAQLEAQVRTGELDDLLSERTVTVSDDDLTVTTKVCSTSIKWFGILDVVQLEAHTFILLSPTSAHVVPKRAFANEEQWEQFNEKLARTFANSSMVEKRLSPINVSIQFGTIGIRQSRDGSPTPSTSCGW